jgi:hypothetical protein
MRRPFGFFVLNKRGLSRASLFRKICGRDAEKPVGARRGGKKLYVFRRGKRRQGPPLFLRFFHDSLEPAKTQPILGLVRKFYAFDPWEQRWFSHLAALSSISDLAPNVLAINGGYDCL